MNHFEEERVVEADVWIAVNPAWRQVAWQLPNEFHIRRELGGEQCYYPDGADIHRDLPHASYLTYSPDGRRLVVVADGHFIYETRSGQRIGRLNKTNAERNSFQKGPPVFSADGSYLAQALEEQIVLWEVESGLLFERLPIANSIIDFDPQGRFFVAADGSTVRVFQLNDHRQIMETRHVDGGTPAIDMAGNSSLSIAEPIAHQYDWALFSSMSLTNSDIHLDQFAANDWFEYDPCVAISRDGRHSVMSNKRFGAIASQKTQHGWERRILPMDFVEELPLDVLMDSQSPVPADEDGRRFVRNVLRRNLDAGKVENRLTISEDQLPDKPTMFRPVLHLKLGRLTAGSQLRYGDSKSGTNIESRMAGRFLSRRFSNFVSLRPVDRKDIGEELQFFVSEDFSKDDAVSTIERVLLASPLDKNENLREATFLAGPFDYSPDSSRLWGIVNEERLWSWDTDSLEIRTRWPSGLKHTVLLDVDAGQHWVATCSRNGSVQFSDAETGNYWPEISRALRPKKPMRNVDLSSDETWCLVSGDAGRLEHLAVPSGRVLKVIHEQADAFTAQCLSKDDRILATGDISGRCRLWLRKDGEYRRLVDLPKFNAPIANLCISEDGRTMALTVKHERCVYLFRLDRMLDRFRSAGLLHRGI